MSAPEGLLRPPVDEVSRPFWEGCRAGELRVQRCTATGRLFFPPRPFSPFAPRAAPEWVRVSGRGTLWSFAVPHPPLLPAYAERAPYPVVAVALDEEPTLRLVGHVLARPGGPVNEVDPASLRIGAPLRVTFEPLSDEIHLPAWLPA